MSQPKFKILAKARTDIEAYMDYLAQQVDEDMAQRFAFAALKTAHETIHLPLRYPLYSNSIGLNTSSDLRFRPVIDFPKVVMFYRVRAGDQLDVVRVLHSSRDFTVELN